MGSSSPASVMYTSRRGSGSGAKRILRPLEGVRARSGALEAVGVALLPLATALSELEGMSSEEETELVEDVEDSDAGWLWAERIYGMFLGEFGAEDTGEGLRRMPQRGWRVEGLLADGTRRWLPAGGGIMAVMIDGGGRGKSRSTGCGYGVGAMCGGAVVVVVDSRGGMVDDVKSGVEGRGGGCAEFGEDEGEGERPSLNERGAVVGVCLHYSLLLRQSPYLLGELGGLFPGSGSLVHRSI